MKHPDPDRCRELGTLFLMIDAEPTTKEVNMGEISWPNDNLNSNTRIGCGTQACHAGWFAWGCDIDNLCGTHNVRSFDYEDSADKMAIFLGQDDMESLKDWADDNQGLWGNDCGVYLFSSNSSIKDQDIITLKDIGIHWLKVADRIEAHEKKA